MSIRAPHFLLMSETSTEEDQNQWRFVLASADGDQKLVASDTEPATQGERLELLSVVRGLEALEQPSQVTLLTDSRYVSQGIAHGLPEWRTNDWCWERFGELTPVKNLDLWRRVDHALKFHRVDCRTWRFDAAHTTAEPATAVAETQGGAPPKRLPAAARNRLKRASVARQASEVGVDQNSFTPTHHESAERLPSRRPAPRRGLLAACRGWLEQTADTVLGSQSKISLES